MKHSVAIYNELKQKVSFLYKKLKLSKYEKSKGRKLKLSLKETITLALYKHKKDIGTKKSLYEMFEMNCVYKTLVVNINKCIMLSLLVLINILRSERENAHFIRHTDSTDIPVCFNKNAKRHKTIKTLSNWGHSGKGLFYGIKLHITTDLNRKLLSIGFAPGNVDDRVMFKKINKDLNGLFVADAGYVSEKLAREFYRVNKRMLFAKPRKNMKKLATEFQLKLYETRMIIELNFRSLKMFYGLVTSLPRSIDGYIGNYIYSILSYVLR
jgi:hypothetical protein